MKKYFNYVVTTVALVGIAGISVSAKDKPLDADEWKMMASTAINSVMKYPRLAMRQGDTGSSSFVVTIDREGEVVDYYSTGRKGSIHFKTAAVKSINKTDFPAIPEAYREDMLSFTLNMEYTMPAPLEAHKYRAPKESAGSVSGTQIALLPSVSLSSGQ